LCLLRSCNGLLKRLSKAQDLRLCGRILIFIARIYPLADKSGVNLHGAVSAGLDWPKIHLDTRALKAFFTCQQMRGMAEAKDPTRERCFLSSVSYHSLAIRCCR
jgi:hypothetical protein